LVPDLADWSVVHMLGDDGKLEQVAVAHKDPGKIKWALELQQKRAREINLSEDPAEKIRLESIKHGQPQFFPNFDGKLLRKMVKRKSDRDLIRELGILSSMRVPIVSGSNWNSH